MSDLERRLDSLFRRGLIRKGLPEERKGAGPDGGRSAPPPSAFQAEEVGEGDTRCLRYSHLFPEQHVHGRMVPVGGLLSDPSLHGEINIVRGEPLAPRRELLFLDIETTGLAMGTGTYAFLIGVGSFVDGAFRVDQYFMRDFDEEECLLSVLEDVVAPFRQVVTFNGRTFDLQLLRNRYLLAGILPPFDGKPDLDLLFPSRRFFRDRIENCRLTTIERELIGFEREGDVDGSLIPDLYFRFLRTGEFPQLDLILRHNAWDVLSMACLAHLFVRSLSDPFDAAGLHGGAFLGIGDYLEEVGSQTDGVVERCYQEAMKTGLDNREGYEAARRVGLAFRRQNDHAGASEIWRMMAAGNVRDTFPLVELAKHYEHRAKDYGKAIECVDGALDVLAGQAERLSPYRSARLRQELLYRRARLERRLGKRMGKSPLG